MLSPHPNNNLPSEIQELLSKSTETITSTLNNQEFIENLKFKFISTAISLDQSNISDKDLTLNLTSIRNSYFRFKIGILYLESMSQAMFKNQISSEIYDNAINMIIENFKQLKPYFITRHKVWREFLNAAPQILSSSIDYPLVNLSDLIKQEIQSSFFLKINRSLFLSMAMSLKTYHQLDFIINLIEKRDDQIKFLKNFINSLRNISPPPLSTEDTSNLINYFIEKFDKKEPRENSLKETALTLILDKPFYLKTETPNPFIIFIQQNPDLTIETIKKDNSFFEINAPLFFNLLRQAKIPVQSLLSRINKFEKVNFLLHNAILNSIRINSLPVSSSYDKIYFFKHLAMIFNYLTTTFNNITSSEKILSNTLIIVETHLFKDTQASERFINNIIPSSRYHFSLSFIHYLLREQRSISSKFLNYISMDLPPITEKSISVAPFSSHRFSLIMNFIIDSKSATNNHHIPTESLPLLFWMIKYFHNIINPEFFANTDESFLNNLLNRITRNPSLYFPPFHNRQLLIKQINTFKNDYFTSKNLPIPKLKDSDHVTREDIINPLKKRASPPSVDLTPLTPSEPFNLNLYPDDSPPPPLLPLDPISATALHKSLPSPTIPSDPFYDIFSSEELTTEDTGEPSKKRTCPFSVDLNSPLLPEFSFSPTPCGNLSPLPLTSQPPKFPLPEPTPLTASAVLNDHFSQTPAPFTFQFKNTPPLDSAIPGEPFAQEETKRYLPSMY